MKAKEFLNNKGAKAINSISLPELLEEYKQQEPADEKGWEGLKDKFHSELMPDEVSTTPDEIFDWIKSEIIKLSQPPKQSEVVSELPHFKYLAEFREEQDELFDPDGERYTGCLMSNRQAELMLNTINEMAKWMQELSASKEEEEDVCEFMEGREKPCSVYNNDCNQCPYSIRTSKSTPPIQEESKECEHKETYYKVRFGKTITKCKKCRENIKN